MHWEDIEHCYHLRPYFPKEKCINAHSQTKERNGMRDTEKISGMKILWRELQEKGRPTHVHTGNQISRVKEQRDKDWLQRQKHSICPDQTRHGKVIT